MKKTTKQPLRLTRITVANLGYVVGGAADKTSLLAAGAVRPDITVSLTCKSCEL